jgi:hypothetical protein
MSSRIDSEMQAEHQRRRDPEADHVGSGAFVSRERDRRSRAGLAPQPRRGGLTDQLDLSVTEIAVMWILHHGFVPRPPLRSLSQDIVEFYPVALDTILRTEQMRGARQSDLRLIYFKGLIVAQTHPTLVMIDAIRHADRALAGDGEPSEQPEVLAVPSAEGDLSEEQSTLAHVADALGHSPKSPH